MKQEIYTDELIIGAGLSGLMYGLVAIAENYKVVITESHYKSGGYATCFMREKGKYVFDCSQHKITGLEKNGNLRDSLERAGVWDLLQFHPYEDLTTIIHKGKFMVIPSRAEDIKMMLIKQYDKEVQGINQLFQDITTYGHQHYMFGRMMLGEYEIDKNLLPESRKLAGITAKQYFKNLFKDNELIELLSAIAIYLGTLANEANAFYFLHFLYTTFYTGQAYIKGTGQQLSTILADEFKRRGGTILLNNPAQKIHLDDTLQVSSVDTLKKHIITNKILATCSPSAVISMVGQENLPAAFLNKIASLQIGWSHFCVYMVCTCEPAKLGFESSEYLLVADDGDDCSVEDYQGEGYYNKLTVSITNYHKINAEGGWILQVIILDHASNWFVLSRDEYLTKKTRVQELLLKRVTKYFPKLENNIKFKESSTPKTNFDYTSSQDGSAFGYKVMPRTNLGFLNQFPAKGVKLVSGWTAGPGYEAAMCLGFTHATLQKNKIKRIVQV
jgi:all-trans-retinol 13,14-reductase